MPGLESPIAAAYKLFRAFHGRGPRRGEVRELEGFKTVALEVGEIIRIDYAAKGESVHRFHIFRKTNRPVLFVSADGSQAYVLAGGYRFNAKGLEG
jgi:hypothetical protein